MEFERTVARRDVDAIFVDLRRQWCARSLAHMAAYERSEFVLVARRAEDREDRLGPNDAIRIGIDVGEADVAAGLVERAQRFTRITLLGVAPRGAISDRDGCLTVLLGAFGEPKPFQLRAPRDLSFLARVDLREEAKVASSRDDSGELACMRHYMRVFCFYDDDVRYAEVRLSAGAPLRKHLDDLRELCRSSGLELGPEFSKLRDELREQLE